MRARWSLQACFRNDNVQSPECNNERRSIVGKRVPSGSQYRLFDSHPDLMLFCEAANVTRQTSEKHLRQQNHSFWTRTPIFIDSLTSQVDIQATARSAASFPSWNLIARVKQRLENGKLILLLNSIGSGFLFMGDVDIRYEMCDFGLFFFFFLKKKEPHKDFILKWILSIEIVLIPHLCPWVLSFLTIRLRLHATPHLVGSGLARQFHKLILKYRDTAWSYVYQWLYLFRARSCTSHQRADCHNRQKSVWITTKLELLQVIDTSAFLSPETQKNDEIFTLADLCQSVGRHVPCVFESYWHARLLVCTRDCIVVAQSMLPNSSPGHTVLFFFFYFYFFFNFFFFF